MSYFEDVYLPRINRFGDTLQDRIQGKREHDFIVMMNKSPNKVGVREVNPWAGNTLSYNGVLQTKEYDEDEIQNYLLVPCDQKVPMGHLLYFTDVRRDVEREKPFMAYAEDPYTTAGYNRYTVVELEETLNWIVDGVPYSSPVHATGGGSGARDKNINLKFRIQFSEAGVYLPNKRYSLIMPYNEAIKKNYRVTLGGETWRITGFDKISVSGVMYLTLEEALTDEYDDNPLANTNDLQNWTFTTNQGLNFEIGTETNWEVHQIRSYYKEEEKFGVKLVLVPDEHLQITDTQLNAYSSGSYFSLNKKDKTYEGSAKIEIKFPELNDWIVGTIPISCVNRTVIGNTPAILGSDDIYMENEAVYNIPLASAAAIETAYLSDDKYAEIINRDLEKKEITVKGKSIGEVTLYVQISNQLTISKVINIRSIWLGGKDNVDS